MGFLKQSKQTARRTRRPSLEKQVRRVIAYDKPFCYADDLSSDRSFQRGQAMRFLIDEINDPQSPSETKLYACMLARSLYRNHADLALFGDELKSAGVSTWRGRRID